MVEPRRVGGMGRRPTGGPRNGPRHLLDSNIDWGQDLFYLEDWCERTPKCGRSRVAYYGDLSIGPFEDRVAGIRRSARIKSNRRQTDPAELAPLPGWYALSVNEIYSRDRQYRYFLNFGPVAMAGYSIYIYHITLDEANRVRRELGLPELSSARRQGQRRRREREKERRGEREKGSDLRFEISGAERRQEAFDAA